MSDAPLQITQPQGHAASHREGGNDPLFGLVPIGGIILWSGATTTIPHRWQICNGTNGTPDLRDRFIAGAGSTYAVGDTGGATSNTPSAFSHDHNHDGTAVATHANHTHNAGLALGNIPGGGANNAWNQTASSSVETPALSHSVTQPTGHSNHTFSAIPTLPPYYALAYIMRLS